MNIDLDILRGSHCGSCCYKDSDENESRGNVNHCDVQGLRELDG
jgi:hypothetical protein